MQRSARAIQVCSLFRTSGYDGCIRAVIKHCKLHRRKFGAGHLKHRLFHFNLDRIQAQVDWTHTRFGTDVRQDSRYGAVGDPGAVGDKAALSESLVKARILSSGAELPSGVICGFCGTRAVLFCSKMAYTNCGCTKVSMNPTCHRIRLRTASSGQEAMRPLNFPLLMLLVMPATPRRPTAPASHHDNLWPKCVLDL